MRWLLNVLRSFREHHKPNVEIASVWMDIDTVDFTRAYDCAILLGSHFGESTGADCFSVNGLFRSVTPLYWNLPESNFRSAI